MSGVDGLMQEVDPEVKMFGTLAATDRAFRPVNARLVVGIDNRRWDSAREILRDRSVDAVTMNT